MYNEQNEILSAFFEQNGAKHCDETLAQMVQLAIESEQVTTNALCDMVHRARLITNLLFELEALSHAK
jgi:hypothetical protein